MITPVSEHRVSSIVPSWRPPLLQLLLALTVTAGLLLDPGLVWVGVGLAQLLLIVSWHHALGATDARVGAVLAALLIAATDIFVATGDDSTFYGPIVVVAGVGFLLAVLQQLARRDGRSELTLSLSATVALAVIGSFGAGWSVNLRLDDGVDLAAVAGLAVAGAALGRLAPGLYGALGALILGTGVAALTGSGLPAVGLGLGAAVGAAAALPSALAAVVQTRGGSQLAGWPVGATWPILVAPGLAYLVLRIAGQ